MTVRTVVAEEPELVEEDDAEADDGNEEEEELGPFPIARPPPLPVPRIALAGESPSHETWPNHRIRNLESPREEQDIFLGFCESEIAELSPVRCYDSVRKSTVNCRQGCAVASNPFEPGSIVRLQKPWMSSG